jgi:hypothetical protein
MKYMFRILRNRQEDVFKSIEQLEENFLASMKTEILILSLLGTILINCTLAFCLIRVI